MRIREGDPLEIFTDRDGEVIFKKYSPIGELNAFAAQYAETLYRTCDLMVVICDRDSVISSAGVSKKEYTDKSLSDELERIIESRSLYVHRAGAEGMPVIADGTSHRVACAMPIISEGDIVGCVASLAATDNDGAPDPIEIKLVQTAASFLGRQLEG
jgi:AbrB family transcriptional regulator (stage V sporulation protein T)